MSKATRGLRLDSLTSELQSRGMSTPEAEELSCEFVRRHPFAQRLGMMRLAKYIEQRGLESDSAQGTAGMLIGIELYDRGVTFDQVLGELCGLGLEKSEALESALSSVLDASAQIFASMSERTM